MGILAATRPPLIDTGSALATELSLVCAPGESSVYVMFDDGEYASYTPGTMDIRDTDLWIEGVLPGDNMHGFAYVYLEKASSTVAAKISSSPPDDIIGQGGANAYRYVGCVHFFEGDGYLFTYPMGHSPGGEYSGPLVVGGSTNPGTRMLQFASFAGKTSGSWFTADVTDNVPLTASALQLSFKLSTWSEEIGEGWSAAPQLDMAVSMVGASPYSNAFSSTSAEPFRVLTVSGYNTGSDQGTVVSRTNLWLPVQDVGGQRILALMGNWDWFGNPYTPPDGWPSITSMEVFLLGFIEDSKYTDP